MDGSKKKAGKKAHPHRSKILDNALLHETSGPVNRNLFVPEAPAKKSVVVLQDKGTEIKREALLPVVKKDFKPVAHIGPDNGKKVKSVLRHADSDNTEKADVFGIISDLEKQLDAAFSLKDMQENEIQDLKESLEKAEERAAMLEAGLKKANGKLVAQEKLRLELEAFENEQFEALSEKRVLKEEIAAGSALRKELEDKIAALAEEGESWNNRIGQMELEISNANTTIQNLRHQIFVLEDQEDVLSNKAEAVEAELSSVTTERERYKKELAGAKESLDEIRLTLVDTRTRTRGRYYKSKPK